MRKRTRWTQLKHSEFGVGSRRLWTTGGGFHLGRSQNDGFICGNGSFDCSHAQRESPFEEAQRESSSGALTVGQFQRDRCRCLTAVSGFRWSSNEGVGRISEVWNKQEEIKLKYRIKTPGVNDNLMKIKMGYNQDPPR